MKKRILKVIVGTSVAILVTAAFAQVWVSAQVDNGQGLVGSWDVVVTPRICETGDPAPFPPPFAAIQTYNQGGTMLAKNPPVPGDPLTRVGGDGVWSQLRGRGYSIAFRVFKFNPDGTSAGKDVIRDVVKLGSDGDTYTSTGTVEIYDPAGNLAFTGCATTAATRFR
ncbi:MAG: hypothetical protein ACJ72Z_05850 [Pyrinomonadaceae bacterium]